jgi:hypothetical protein
MRATVDKLRRRLSGDEGWAMATAIVVMSLMVGLGVTFLAFVDNQTRSSARERARDSEFNHTESLLNVQAYMLSTRWPATASAAFPTICNQGNAGTYSDKCPTASVLSSSYATPDFRAGTTWTTQVRDNGQYNGKSYQSFYSDDLLNAAPSWDANGDGEVWVRAQTKLRGMRRTVVARVKVEKHPELLPQNPIIANILTTGNNGKKIIIDTLGPSPVAKDVLLRGCTAQSIINILLNLLLPNPPCLDLDLRKGQLSPLKLVGGFTGPAVDPAVVGRLKQTAQAQGTYYATCPSNPVGSVVYVESGDCVYTASAVGAEINSVASPGIFIVNNGSFSLSGNTTFHGVVYGLNAQNTSGNVVTLSGGATIMGALYVDGNGSVRAGQSGDGGDNEANVTFDARVFANFFTYLNAGVIQNTFREINGTPTA